MKYSIEVAGKIQLQEDFKLIEIIIVYALNLEIVMLIIILECLYQIFHYQCLRIKMILNLIQRGNQQRLMLMIYNSNINVNLFNNNKLNKLKK